MATIIVAQLICMVGASFVAAEPANMAPVSPEVPRAINDVLPPAPYPRLQRIPQRAQAPGFSHRIQELREAVLPSPTGDPFFDRWPPGLADLEPGAVIATRDVTLTAALALFSPIASATQIKFATRDAVGRPSFGTATVVAPIGRWNGRGSRPILISNLPIDSLGASCTIGVTLAHGGEAVSGGAADHFPPTTQLALARGYAVLIPDHQGPRMAYAEPTTAGRIILDSVRAVLRLDRKKFGNSRIGMYGYSGGAIATNGAVKLVDSYAPELASRIVGAAIGGVPADFRMLVGSMNANLATGVFHSATLGIARERTEILTMANDLAQWLATSPLKNICFMPAAIAGATFFPMQLMSNDPDPFHSPVAERIYDVTKMSSTKSTVPLYIYNGIQEWWIPAAGARGLYRQQCLLGANATYREVIGEHVVAGVVGYPEAVYWLDERLQGRPPVSGCPARN